MELNTILTMILLLGFVWGGFAFTLRMAFKKNGEKKRLRAVAFYVIGDGHQPYEGMLSEICKAFNCTPDVAERQDLRQVMAIMDYRMAESAKDQHNQDASKMTPPMTKLWVEMIGFAEDENG